MSGERDGWGRRGRCFRAVIALAFAAFAFALPAFAKADVGAAPAAEIVAAGEGASEVDRDAPAHRFADFMSHPAVAGLVLSIGIWALIFAFVIPGTGVPEVVAVLAFGAFLLGKHAAGLAGWEDVALVGAGAALLAVEIFIVPGLGVAGILGALAILGGLAMAAIGHGPGSPQFWPELTRAVTVLGVATGLGIAWSVMAYFALRKTEMWKRFTLRGALGPADDDGAPDAPHRALASLAGSEGVAVTALRPEGDVEIGGQTYEARAERAYLDTKARVEVVSHDGQRLVVRGAGDRDETAEDGADNAS